jgi:hypothetical protein
MSKKSSNKIKKKHAKRRGGILPEKEFDEIMQRIVRVKPKRNK